MQGEQQFGNPEDLWGVSSSTGQTTNQRVAERQSNPDGHNVNQQAAVQEFQNRPRNHGKYAGGQKQFYRRHKHVPWYQRGTPRGFTRKVNFQVDAAIPDDFDESQLKITEEEQLLAYSILKDPDMYSQEDLQSMLILITKFPQESEDNLWQMLSYNGGDIEPVYSYFSQK
eukprot:TRINITY_DN3789_c0_g1_i2.p2 TRINITY_DN3789_c0_g1~~TRINITY_DN3789_c0_g1_i2.p2  ORF type:complete len:170 (-),score=19.03 TRINITY_DN3789_c0_g1_i2:1212-1721(-)